MIKFEINDLLPLSIYDLRAIGREYGVKSPTSLKRNDLIRNIMGICNGEIEPVQKTNRGRPAKDANASERIKNALSSQKEDDDEILFVDATIAARPEFADVETKENEFFDESAAELRGGVMQLNAEGYGFLRQGLKPQEDDIYVSNSQIKHFNLKTGDYVFGAVSPATPGRRYASILRLDTVNELNPEFLHTRKPFASLTPVTPSERYRLDVTNQPAMRLLELIAPLGKGQRTLLEASHKSGKSTLLKQLAAAVLESDPNCRVIVLLIDERPEDITSFQRSLLSPRAEFLCSSFDEPSQYHIELAERALERAKRLVECGMDVVLLADSLTKLARAYNIAGAPSGKLLGGGLDPAALFHPKRFFCAARKAEEGGSLTIVGCVLTESGSTMNDIIADEFGEYANMTVRLTREIAERRVFPAVDPTGTRTYTDIQITTPEEQAIQSKVRQALAGLSPAEAGERLAELIRDTQSNAEIPDKLG